MADEYPQAVLVDDFLNLARQYREAYYALPEVTPISWPRYFLFCHSIELVLKAYLAQAAGLPEDKLQKPPFGHNLKDLLDQAIEYGLSLSASARGAPYGRTHEALAALPDDNVRPHSLNLAGPVRARSK
jgi:hypothetical protein